MPTLFFKADFSIRFSSPASRHSYLLRCLPRRESFQTPLSTACLVQDAPPAPAVPDAFGNPVVTGRIAGAHDVFAVHAEGLVRVRTYRICDVPHPACRTQTRLTACTPEMADVARALAAKYGMGPGKSLDLALAAAGYVHGRLVYEPRRTHSFTPASEALRIGRGVCQDYAHVLLGILRRAGLAARYVCGYVPGEGASHAWCEVFADGVWLAVDPTCNRLVRTGCIKVAHGRDSDDCPMNRGCFTGGGSSQETTVSVAVTEA